MIVAIILAAGASTRMGTPKLLLPVKGKSILRHVVDEALTSRADAVVVVLGAHADRLRSEVEGRGVSVVVNPDWEEGLSSSIRVGIEAASANKDPDAVVLLLADQPLTSAKVINELIQTFESTGKVIVASEYAGTMGPPILFGRPLFLELLTLEGDRGAKQVIGRYPEQVAAIPVPEASVDIDTMEDYQKLLNAEE